MTHLLDSPFGGLVAAGGWLAVVFLGGMACNLLAWVDMRFHDWRAGVRA